MTTYAIVGSTTFPLSEGAGYILRQMTKLNKEDHVIVRGENHLGDKDVPLRGVDSMVVVFAKALGLHYEVVPLPRVSNGSFERAAIVAKVSDAVWAFYDPNKVMAGGTALVTNLALTLDKDVRAWTVRDGELSEVGNS